MGTSQQGPIGGTGQAAESLDEARPNGIDSGLVAALSDIAQRSPISTQSFRRRVRDLILVCSSSRGGSSVFSEMLRHSEDLLHFRAEINPFLVLSELSWPRSETGSDQLHAHHATRADALDFWLAWDVGGQAERLRNDEELDRFAVHLTWRLQAQWPEERFEIDEVHRRALEVLREPSDNHPGIDDPQHFHICFLKRLRRDHPRVNPYYYDLDPALIARLDPEAGVPDGPPSDFLIEEPPFVATLPWAVPTAEEIESRPLVIKTPSNAYRLPFFRAFFPNARIRTLHLTRHAADAINGLYDGWLHRGFFSHPVQAALGGRELSIPSYSDDQPEWGKSWWNFDLPPGWQEWIDAPLEQVCAFQWRAAHQAVLDWVAEADSVDYFRVSFEESVLASPAKRREVFERLAAWIGIPYRGGLARAVQRGLPPIMAMAPPKRDGGGARAERIEPLLREPRNRELLLRLDYPAPAPREGP